MTLAALAPVFVAVCAVVLIVLERAFPYTHGQRIVRDGFWNDLVMYSVVQNYALGWLITAGIARLDASTGWSSRGLISGWPIVVQFAFFLVTHDLYIYWFHRWQHHSATLWRLHEAHHSTRDVDWLSGTRSHPLEILINQTIEFAPILLLGAHPVVPLLKGMVDAVWGMFIHSNIDVRLGPLSAVINGPEQHRRHHSAVAGEGNANYGTKFAFWDLLFRTARGSGDPKPAAFGIADIDFPRGYFRQVFFAFRAESP